MDLADLEQMDMEIGKKNAPEVNENFYEKYSPQIRAIVSRILSGSNLSQDVEDCVNTVFLDLMERLRQYNETKGSLAAFVAVIARSVALNYCKSKKNKMGELVGDDNIEFLGEPLELINRRTK